MNKKFNDLCTRLAALICALVISCSAAAIDVNFTGFGEILFFDENSGEETGFVLLGIDGYFSIDPLTPANATNNFTGAAHSLELFIDYVDVSPSGMPPADLSSFPYFTSFNNNNELLVGDVFFNNNEINIDFPSFSGGGPAPLSMEPFGLALIASSSLFPSGDLPGLTSLLLGENNPLDLFAGGLAEIYFQTSGLGPDFEDNLFFELDTLTVTGSAVPLPASLWLFGSSFLALAGIRRKRRI